jgi:single-stranded DNA-binding protein
VVVWREQAEHAARSLAKGSRAMVIGRLQQRTWTAGTERPAGRGRGRGAGPQPAVGDRHADPGDQVELSRAGCRATTGVLRRTRSR